MKKELLSMLALSAEPILFTLAIVFLILSFVDAKKQKQRLQTAWIFLSLGIVQSLLWIGIGIFTGRV